MGVMSLREEFVHFSNRVKHYKRDSGRNQGAYDFQS